MTQADRTPIPWRILLAAATFTGLMVAAGVAADRLAISGDAKLPLMLPGLVALGWLGWEALRLARTADGATPALIRYVRRMIPLSFGYVVALILALTIQRHWLPTGLFAVAVAILPALPLITFIWVLGRLLVEEQDEYQRMLHARRALAATGFMLVVMTVWGFLEGAGLVPHLPAYAAFILWNVGLLFAPLMPGMRA